jgi:hypothetical protein
LSKEKGNGKGLQKLLNVHLLEGEKEDCFKKGKKGTVCSTGEEMERVFKNACNAGLFQERKDYILYRAGKAKSLPQGEEKHSFF